MLIQPREQVLAKGPSVKGDPGQGGASPLAMRTRILDE